MQLQAGLGRPANYKNGAVVDAALGLRKGRGWRVEVRIHIQPLRGCPGVVALLVPALHAGLFMLNP